jgi:hypothetical protein
MIDIKSYIKKVQSNGSTIITVEAGPVPNDRVFQLLNITGYHDNQAVTEITKFYYTSEGNKHYIHADVPKAVAVPVSFSQKVFIPQGYRFGVEFPNAANTEWMYLSLTGVIMPLQSFREILSKL